MNKFSLVSILSCAAIALAPFATVNAADDDGAPKPPPPRRERGFGPGGPGGERGFGPGGPGGARGGQFALPPRLTPEERAKFNEAYKKIAKDEGVLKASAELKEARQKAIAAQKKVDESTKKLSKAAKEALLKTSPNDAELAAIIKKFGDRPLRPVPARQVGERPAGDRPNGPRAGAGERRRGRNADRPAPEKAPSAENL
jgi:hypothetical protein